MCPQDFKIPELCILADTHTPAMQETPSKKVKFRYFPLFVIQSQGLEPLIRLIHHIAISGIYLDMAMPKICTQQESPSTLALR